MAKKATPKKRAKKKVAARKPKRGTKKKSVTKKEPATKPKPADVVSMAELARQIGVTRRAVEKAIEDGRITDAVKTRPTGAGKAWKIDLAKAIRLWELGTNFAHRPDAELEARARKAKGTPPTDPLPEKQENGSFEGLQPPKFAISRARKEAALAELKEMEVAEERMDLLRRKKVQKVLFEIVRTQREAFQGMPGRLAGELATLDDPGAIERFLALEVRRTLEEAAESVHRITDHQADVG